MLAVTPKPLLKHSRLYPFRLPHLHGAGIDSYRYATDASSHSRTFLTSCDLWKP